MGLLKSRVDVFGRGLQMCCEPPESFVAVLGNHQNDQKFPDFILHVVELEDMTAPVQC